QAQESVQSLVVHFTLETLDPVFHDRKRSTGSFKLLRTRGDILVFYQVKELEPDDKKSPWTALLNCGTIYVLNCDEKTALKFSPDGDVRGFLEKYWNPIVVLLDKKDAQKCALQFAKRDEWYTYLTLEPRARFSFSSARVVLMNKASSDIPE